MNPNKIVPREEWVAARKAHLANEKAFTKARDLLHRERRSLPWLRVDKAYSFDGPGGRESLADLFEGRSQLIVYHFMFGPDWEEGCPSCSFVSDHIDGALPHLRARDVTLLAVSRAPLAKLAAFQRRMGWGFKWVSSADGDFNFDHQVSFTPEQRAAGGAKYNYAPLTYDMDELHGLSVFYKTADGEIFQTYSSYGRGCDLLVGAYNYLDMAPKGRDEDGLDFTMSWLRHHDRYEDQVVASHDCCAAREDAA